MTYSNLSCTEPVVTFPELPPSHQSSWLELKTPLWTPTNSAVRRKVQFHVLVEQSWQEVDIVLVGQDGHTCPMGMYEAKELVMNPTL